MSLEEVCNNQSQIWKRMRILHVTMLLHNEFRYFEEGGERGRRPPLPEIVRSSYRRLR